MSGANYYLCPLCDRKALYSGEDDHDASIEVLHVECLERDRAERETVLREQIACLIDAEYDKIHGRPVGYDEGRQSAYDHAAQIVRGEVTGQ